MMLKNNQRRISQRSIDGGINLEKTNLLCHRTLKATNKYTGQNKGFGRQSTSGNLGLFMTQKGTGKEKKGRQPTTGYLRISFEKAFSRGDQSWQRAVTWRGCVQMSPAY